MPRICPSCGTTAVDDQAQFCNKCGYPFPKVRPDNATLVQRKGTRIYDEQVHEHRPASPAHNPTPVRKPAGSSRPLPFKKFLIGDRLRLIYIAGAVAIVVIALLGISTGFSKVGTDATKTLTNTTALVATPTSSPLFWIAFLIFGSLVWRMFCEMAALIFRMYGPAGNGECGEGGTVSGGEVLAPAEAGPEERYECPQCGKVVPAGELRQCEHCGVQGCSHCIRKMGMIKKTLTCRDCFEKK